MKLAWMCACTAAAVTLAQTVFAQDRIPVRTLAPVSSTSSETFGAVLGVRELSNGRLLVSDARKKRLLVLDTTLHTAGVVLDSVAGLPNYYGERPVPIIAYLADSSITFDFRATTLLLIDPAGGVARAMAVPNSRDITAMGGSAAFVDDRGRLVFRGAGKSGMGGAGRSPLMVTNDEDGMKSNADSVPLLRADLQARSTDTLAALSNFYARRLVLDTSNGGLGMTLYANPLQTGDEWAMLSDGTVAIVRGHDYHIDWIAMDGVVTSTAKLPFDWKRIEVTDKQRIIDSARMRDSTDRIKRTNSTTGANGAPVRGGAPTSDAMRRNGRGGDNSGDAPPARVPRPPQLLFVPANELPDYLPPIRPGAVRGDLDGNLWILPTTSAQSLNGELVYDVVNRKGELFERVRLPAQRIIVGFGRGGVVYLASGSLGEGFHLERTRIPRQ